jgi:hypothetical protein
MSLSVSLYLMILFFMLGLALGELSDIRKALQKIAERKEK